MNRVEVGGTWAMYIVTAVEDRLYMYMDIGQTIGNDVNMILFTTIIYNIIYIRTTILCSMVNVLYYFQGIVTLLVQILHN